MAKKTKTKGYIGFQLDIELYEKAKKIAQSRGERLSAYMRGLIDRDKTDELIDKAVKKGEKTK